MMLPVSSLGLLRAIKDPVDQVNGQVHSFWDGLPVRVIPVVHVVRSGSSRDARV